MKIYLSQNKLIDYVFKSLNQEEEEQITQFLIENPDYKDAVEGIINLCLDMQFNRQQLEDYLSTIDFNIGNSLLKNSNEAAIIKDNLVFIWFHNKRSHFVAAASILLACISLVFIINNNRKLNILKHENENLLSENRMLLERTEIFDSITLINKNYELKIDSKLIQNKAFYISEYIKQAEEYKIIANAFLPNEEMEQKMNTLALERSENLTAYPSENKIFKKGESIIFKWTTSEKVVFFHLMKNTGTELKIMKNPTSGTINFNDLKPGLYYWQIESTRNILFLGTFYVTID